MRVRSSFEWRQQCRLQDENDRLRSLLQKPRSAAASRADHEPCDVTDDEAARLADAVRGLRAAIDKALARIEAGTYGLCATCTAPIAEDRLDALPAAALCLDCAAGQEHIQTDRNALNPSYG